MLKKEPDYRDPELPAASRAADLMARMTPEEKVSQLFSVDTNSLHIEESDLSAALEAGRLLDEQLIEKLKHGIGSFQLPGKSLSPEKSALYRNLLQRHIKEHTRLQIPVLSQEECLMGQLAKGATMFPRPIGLAGTFDPGLVEEIYRAVGRETSSRGAHQAFTPVLDIGRDPRWGRIEETFGEDTCLVTRMGVSVVKGLQGGSDGVHEGHIVSSPKHFAGYGQCAGGRNFAPTDIPLRQFTDEILPPFKAAVMEAHAKGIMPSHSEIDGVPCHGNTWLLTDLLRGEWGFDGIVISDYDDASRLDILHHVEEDLTGASVRALAAGLDMDIPIGSAFHSLLDAAVRSDEVMSLIDRAVSRVLKLKFELGLFEKVLVEPEQAAVLVNCPEHRALAKRAADKTLILLKNEQELLPLDLESLTSLAVIGPNADPVEFSYYSTRPNVGVSILDGIREKVGDRCRISYEMGCHITDDSMVIETETEVVVRNPGLYTFEEEKAYIERAVAAAAGSDAAVVCIGGSPSTSREAVTLMKHYGDNAYLGLLGQQEELLRRVLETGTPTIVMIISGKPISSPYLYEHAGSVIQGWYLGQETGRSVADALFGDVNPGGKLPVTIPRSAGHLPSYYSQKPTGVLKDYIFEIEGPLFPFGFGLSYTTFRLEGLTLSKPVISMHEESLVSIDVTNTGNRTGDEVIQLYIRDDVASITRPVRLLKDFKRITLQPGEEQRVSFTLTSKLFEFTGLDYRPTIEAGTFTIMVGTSSEEYDTVTLTLTE